MNGDFELGEWAVQSKLNAVVRNGSSRHVSPKGMEVLLFLAKRQGDVVSKEDILAAVWEGTFVTDDALTRCIGELRRVFEDDARAPHVIQTIPKSGYRLVPPIRWLADDGGVQRDGDATATREEEPRGACSPRAPATAPADDAVTDPPAPANTSDSAGGVRPVVPRRRLRRITIAAAALALFGGVAAAVGVTVRLRPVAGPRLVVSAIGLEPGYALAGMNSRTGVPTRTAMTISSDGSFVVYSAQKEGTDERRLFLRRLDEPRATAIAGTEGGLAPFLSPDDRWVGFLADGQLKKVSTDGGPATVILPTLSLPFGASWGSDGYIVFSSGFGAGLYRIRSDGGTPEILTTRLPGEFHHRLPHCLPAGKGVLLTITALPMDPHPRVVVVDYRGRTRGVLEDAADARYVAAGLLVFVRQGSLLAVPFDLDRLRTTGQAIPLGIAVAQAMNVPSTTEQTSAGQFAISDSGALVYAAGGIVPDEQHSLVWVGQDGKEVGQAVPFTAPFLSARFSPDGRQLAYTLAGMQSRMCLYDMKRGAASDLTKEGRVNFAIWTRDSQGLVFGWSKSGPTNLFTQPVDQSTPPQAITADETCTGQGPGSWSADGNLLAFWRQFPDTTNQILILDRRSGATTCFVKGRPGEGLSQPEFSPDGRWLAYAANEAGRPQVYVTAYPQGGKWPISAEGGTEPLWAQDGKRLFYRFDGRVWVVDLDTSVGLRRGKPRLVFAHAEKYLSSGPGRTWDLSPDGRRFLMVRLQVSTRQPVTQMVLIQNWTSKLARLVKSAALPQAPQ